MRGVICVIGPHVSNGYMGGLQQKGSTMMTIWIAALLGSTHAPQNTCAGLGERTLSSGKFKPYKMVVWQPSDMAATPLDGHS